MKLSRAIFFLFAFFLVSCSSENDNGDTTPMSIDVSGTLDVTALASLVGTDATALVKFNGVSADAYRSEVIPGDKLNYKIDNSSANTEVRITDFRFNFTGSTVSSIDWEENVTVVVDTLSTPAVAYIQINSNAATDDNGDDEYKFDIDFKVYTNGTSNHTVYSTDPKIKIKSKR